MAVKDTVVPAHAVSVVALNVTVGKAKGNTFTVSVTTPQAFVKLNEYVTALVPVGAETVYVGPIATGELHDGLTVPVTEEFEIEYDNTEETDGHNE